MTAEALRVPCVADVFRRQATNPEATSPEELGEFVREEQERWAAVIRAADVHLE